MRVGKSFFRSVFRLALVAVLTFVLMLPTVTSAMSNSQRRIFDLGIPYYNVGPDTATSVTSPPCVDVAPDGSKTVIIGDSITDGSRSALSSKLSGIEINGVTSRNFAGTSTYQGATDPGGLAVVQAATALREYVVIALGTNGGVTEANINTMISDIESRGGKTIIFVNNYYKGDINHYQSNNSLFAAVAAAHSNVFVADWASAANADPEKYINNDGLNVHPTTEGRELFAQVIYDALGGVRMSNIAGGDLNSPAPTSLVGSSNPEKIWNYFKQRGLTDVAAAGVLGNMAQESSTFNPFENGEHGTNNTSKEVLGKGFGLIQWTNTEGNTHGNRYQIMTYLEQNGVVLFSTDPAEIDKGILYSLQFLWDTNPYDWITKLNQETTVDGDPTVTTWSTSANVGNGSALLFHALVERSGDGPAGKQERIDSARDYLELYSGIAGSTEGCGGPNGTSYSLDIDSVRQAWEDAVNSGWLADNGWDQDDSRNGFDTECPTIVKWFITNYTTLEYADGSGGVVVNNLVNNSHNRAAGLTSVSEPIAPAVFSIAGGKIGWGSHGSSYGHTGLVLGVNENNGMQIVVHTWDGVENNWDGTYKHSVIREYAAPHPGVSFANVGSFLKSEGN